MLPRRLIIGTTAVFWAALIAAAGVLAQSPMLPPGSAHADSLARRTERARRLGEQKPASPTSLDAETAALRADGTQTSELQVIDLEARILVHPRDAELYNKLGVLRSSRQEWSLAREALISALQIDPRRAEYHRNLAIALVHLGTYPLAASEIAAYQRLDPSGSGDAWRLMGEAYAAEGQAVKARESFAAGLAKLPPDRGDERVCCALGLAQVDQDAGRPLEARATLEAHLAEAQQLLAAPPAADTTAVGCARAVVSRLVAGYVAEAGTRETDSPADAATLYGKALELAPGREDAVTGIVGVYLALGQQEKAREIVQRATTEHPQVAAAWLALGRVAEEGADFPGAIKAYEQAIALGSTRPDLKVRLGNLYLQTGNGASGRRYLADAVADPGAAPATLYSYAVSLIHDQKYNLATAPLNRLVKVDPEMAQAWSALALCFQETQQFGEAAGAYRKAIALGPDPQLSFNLAYCLSRQGKSDEAIAAFREAARLDPLSKESQYSLARALLDAGKYDEAMPELEATLKLDPEHAMAYFGLGLCWYNKRDYPKAIEAYRQSLARRQSSATQQNLGLAFDQMGLKEDAAKCYAEAKKLKAAGK